MDRLRICIAGITGWTGRAVAQSLLAAPDLELVAAVARGAAGQDAGLVSGGSTPCGVTCHASLDEALATPFDVLIDYTKPHVVKGHTLAALAAGRHVVIGTSGLTGDDFAEIARAADSAGRGVIASGNFSLTAALMTRFALLATKYLDKFEILDFAGHAKIDAPSGTARELAERMGALRQPALGRPLDEITGPREARGASVNGVQVHSIRLPSYSASVQVEFAVPGSRLSIAHDAGMDASIYAEGTLLAARRVPGICGLVRGLDTLLD